MSSVVDLELPSSSQQTGPPRAPASSFRYKSPPEKIVFPSSEPEDLRVPESPRHLINRTELWQSACDALSDKGVISSDQFLYWDPADPYRRLAPDFLIRLGQPGPPPDSWKIWEHGHPDVAVEIISPSDAPDTPWQVKLGRYRQIAIKELVRFDAAQPKSPLRVWDFCEVELVERELDDRRCAESRLLSLYFVVVEHPRYGPWLRLARDPAGQDLLLTPGERALRAEQAARNAALGARREVLMTLLRARGHAPADEDRARIAAAADAAVLDRWIIRAATAATLAEVFSGA